MKVQILSNSLKVTREGWDEADTEQEFIAELSLALFDKGYNTEVFDPSVEDGNLTSATWAIRDIDGKYTIWDGYYQVRDIADDFRLLGEVTLIIKGEIE